MKTLRDRAGRPRSLQFWRHAPPIGAVARGLLIVLRDRWRRTTFGKFLHELEPIDRATFYIAIVLAVAIGFVGTRIMRAHLDAPSVGGAPRLTAPPFDLKFASRVMEDAC